MPTARRGHEIGLTCLTMLSALPRKAVEMAPELPMAENADNEVGNSPRKLTESPWFWLELFSYFALLALLIMGPKYTRRQGVIEQRFKAKRDVARQQFEGRSSSDASESSRRSADDADDQDTDDVENKP